MKEISKFVEYNNPPYKIQTLNESIIHGDSLEILSFIISNMTDSINQIDKNGKTPIEYAVSEKVIQFLLNRGSNSVSEIQLQKQIQDNRKRVEMVKEYFQKYSSLKNTLKELPITEDIMLKTVGMLVHLDNGNELYSRSWIDILPSMNEIGIPKLIRQKRLAKIQYLTT